VKATTADQTPPIGPEAPVPEARRVVACQRCRAPLSFPTGYSAQHLAPVLFCRKCGARTPLPSRMRWLYRLLAILIFIAASAFVLFTIFKADPASPF
jgi:hypothetical protein